MFSKPLFKQSCKANGLMWAIVTIATCFMLACVMMVVGGGDLAAVKVSVTDTIIKGEVTSRLQTRAIGNYLVAENALEHFDGTILELSGKEEYSVPETEEVLAYLAAYNAAVSAGKTPEEALAVADSVTDKVAVRACCAVLLAGGTQEEAYAAAAQAIYSSVYGGAVAEMRDYAASLAEEKGYAEGSAEALELQGAIFYVLNPMTGEDEYMFDDFYTALGEEPPRYDVAGILTSSEEDRADYRQEYAAENAAVFIAGNMVGEENISMILAALKDYGVTAEQYAEFGFADYAEVKEISVFALVDFRANYAYRLEHMQDGETEESIAGEVTAGVAESLLASLPEGVADALAEIGQMDLYGSLVGSIFYKMAGLLLPVVYLIMTANSLIAGQVDSGSMAYVLSTSVKRNTVVFTQAMFLVLSLFAMFFCTSVTSLVCFSLAEADTGLTYGKLLLMNLGAFLVSFAMSGICFFTSCQFNRSKYSMGIGGGINMFFLVASMLGLFGSSVMPSIMRMDALNGFNYITIISLFDEVSVLAGGTAYLWKMAVLVAVGLIFYIAGSIRFRKKDLPL